MIFRVNINIQRMEPVAFFFFSLVFRSCLMPLLFLLAWCGRNLSLTTKTCFWLSSGTHISSQPVYKKEEKNALIAQYASMCLRFCLSIFFLLANSTYIPPCRPASPSAPGRNSFACDRLGAATRQPRLRPD